MAFAMKSPASMQVLFLYPKVISRSNVGDRLAKQLSAGSYPKWMMLRFEFILALHELSGTGVLGWKWNILVGRNPFLIGRGFDRARSQIK